MTPGTYIRRRREAAELSVDELATMIVTQPHIAAHDRAAWLRLIEADVVPVGDDVIEPLMERFPFDPIVLMQLVDLHHSARLPAPQICRVCACSDKDACYVATQPGLVACFWADRDLCSACAPNGESDGAALVPATESEAA